MEIRRSPDLDRKKSSPTPSPTPTATPTATPTTTPTPTPAPVKQVTTGQNHTCALIENSNEVRCWGYNGYGQLGVPSSNPINVPVPVTGFSGTVLQIVASRFANCALIQGGTVQCWGSNNSGELGDGTGNSNHTPVTVLGLSNVFSIGAGANFFCAILNDGTGQCWGESYYNQLGAGVYSANSNVPLPVYGLSNALYVSGTSESACAVLLDGTMKCWGHNQQSELGDATLVDSGVLPSTAYGVTNANSISGSSGGYHYCALMSDNTPRCWGSGWYGQLGDGTYYGQIAPISPTVIGTVSKIAAGGNGDFEYSCAIDSGNVKCWGANDSGELGDGTFMDSLTAVQVLGVSSVTDISLGGGFGCAIQSDKSLYCWGNNDSGQLGLGTNEQKNTAHQVLGLEATSFNRLQIVSQTSNEEVSTPFASSIDVASNDLVGNPISIDNAVLTLKVFLDNNCSIPASGTLSGVNPAQATLQSGTASISGIQYNQSENIYIEVSSPGLASICTNQIGIHGNILAYDTAPSAGNAHVLQPFNTPPIVGTYDENGNYITTPAQVTLGLYRD